MSTKPSHPSAPPAASIPVPPPATATSAPRPESESLKLQQEFEAAQRKKRLEQSRLAMEEAAEAARKQREERDRQRLMAAMARDTRHQRELVEGRSHREQGIAKLFADDSKASDDPVVAFTPYADVNHTELCRLMACDQGVARARVVLPLMIKILANVQTGEQKYRKLNKSRGLEPVLRCAPALEALKRVGFANLPGELRAEAPDIGIAAELIAALETEASKANTSVVITCWPLDLSVVDTLDTAELDELFICSMELRKALENVLAADPHNRSDWLTSTAVDTEADAWTRHTGRQPGFVAVLKQLGFAPTRAGVFWSLCPEARDERALEACVCDLRAREAAMQSQTSVWKVCAFMLRKYGLDALRNVFKCIRHRLLRDLLDNPFEQRFHRLHVEKLCPAPRPRGLVSLLRCFGFRSLTNTESDTMSDACTGASDSSADAEMVMETGFGTEEGFDVEWLRAAAAIFDAAVGDLHSD